MLRRLDLRGAVPAAAEIRRLLPRADVDVDVAVDAVRPVCADVRDRGDAAVLAAAERFDGVRPPSLRVPAQVLAAAADVLDPAVRDALTEAIRRTRLVHRAQLREPVAIEVAPGTTVTQRWVPVERVGLYVPGGRVAYPSSVVMNVVPAQEAGVGSLAVFSPPQKDNGGLPHPVILAACALLGVEEVYAAGGAQAVAMAAYGTTSCPPVDVITGPGNVYVTAAKRLLRGVVGVDAEAGPTEVAILADATADPAFVAADLIAQAEHDPMAACLLITPSVELADAVDVELGKQVPATRHRERVAESLAGQGAVALVADVDAGLAVADGWAAEHLEIHTADAAAVAARVRHAGAVFVGDYAPVPLGDYLAGSNHVLPTGGTARHSSGLAVTAFQRQVQVVECTREGLAAVAPRIAALGGAEDLTAHVDAVEVRLR
ncbi:histidinol dehydrogenase [Frankia sp. CcI156]|uniref:Histidinol dehydrogenase n=1 Tax=Frankia casuarinae (strain DSM 45818 / CECT 9043 / HFP020203 / CcI3) TaxID=106370 RepID=Q2J8K8_FRACC|nr:MULTISPECIES: histidinol dehydrogenase [Frankia]ABD12384.1 histidinol dehydrogenase [Frankia casuarinae]ETA02349.1 histidinol dehydrogenase [Frankia sp. CcI6]EYT91294.1 histidinol dehydrogenase [Frankia casuarinae]KDA44794.1 histidinol dehydrogenase [Frankia sp. BMG5.23]KFB04783.1 histidinol dehydrogenase [Frankia sp. Allo2]